MKSLKEMHKRPKVFGQEEFDNLFLQGDA